MEIEERRKLKKEGNWRKKEIEERRKSKRM